MLHHPQQRPLWTAATATTTDGTDRKSAINHRFRAVTRSSDRVTAYNRHGLSGEIGRSDRETNRNNTSVKSFAPHCNHEISNTKRKSTCEVHRVSAAKMM